ncbi:MAG: DoxX family protein [Archangiaceae bacterium]|nr:DoxX family protein [Archangiaceae bacterium]
MHSSALPQARYPAPHDADGVAPEPTVVDPEVDPLVERDRAHAQREALHLAGRLIVAAVFIVSAIVKAAAFDPATAGNLGAVFWVSVVVELGAGALLGAGLFTRKAALVLLLWLGVGLVFFHGDLSVEVNRVFALANLGIAGGLFVLIANGAGLLSLDRWLDDRRKTA